MKPARLLLILVMLTWTGTVIAESRAEVALGQYASTPEDAASVISRWEAIAPPVDIASTPLTALAVHPTDAYIAYLASWDGLYKTLNAGQTWTRVAPSTLSYVPDMVLAQDNPQRLYAVSWNSSLYRTDNGGDSWTQVASPPSICGLSVAQTDGNRVYARGCGGGSAPSIFRSDNGGQTWFTPTLAFTTPLDVLSVSPANANILIGADFDEVFRSPDGGATWTKAPVGTRYFGRPAFDPQPPHTLYLGHWTGLLRSPDGVSWQDSGAAREFTAAIASPFTPGEALGGDDAASWRITSSGNAWNAAAWNAPLPLQSLWRSANDDSVVYARSSAGLWRYVSSSVTMTHTVFLPAVLRNWNESPWPVAAQQALDRINVYRTQASVITLQLHPAIVAAAQNHADYHMLNYDDPSAWTNGAHGEVPGKPGFTGVGAWDRIVAAGYPSQYPWWAGSEVMHFIGDPIASVDGWMATIYHRVIPLDPGARYAGYGYGKNSQTAVDVMDFGGGPADTGMWTSAVPYALAYPADGQTGVPTWWSGGESPDPLPPGASRPVGYPFTLQGVGGTLQVSFAEMRDGSGQVVPIHPNPPDCPAFNCYALIAVAPLQPNTTYTIQTQGNVGGIPFSRTWTFTTGAVAGFGDYDRPLDEPVRPSHTNHPDS